jgi:galactose mutarotase-like enzyme
MKEVILKFGKTQAEILPENGAIVSRLVVGSNEILFPAQVIQTSEGLKKRGGIPILFPNADPITEPTGIFQLKQHGFARDRSWTIEKVAEREATFSLAADEASRAVFPFDFKVTLELEVAERGISYNLSIFNSSESEILPVAPGLHPYFALPLDQRDKIDVDLPGFKSETYDWNSTLTFSGQREVSIKYPDGKRLTIEVAEEFKYWMIWAMPDQPFVCLEPWVGKRNALLHAEERINIPPKGKKVLIMKIVSD